MEQVKNGLGKGTRLGCIDLGTGLEQEEQELRTSHRVEAIRGQCLGQELKSKKGLIGA